MRSWEGFRGIAGRGEPLWGVRGGLRWEHFWGVRGRSSVGTFLGIAWGCDEKAKLDVVRPLGDADR